MNGLDAPRARRRRLSWLGTLAAIVVATAIVVAIVHRATNRDGSAASTSSPNASSPDRSPPGVSGRGTPKPIGDRAGQSPESPSRDRETDVVQPERDEAMMNEWRAAIGRRDPDTVEAINRAFLAHPSRFTGALMSSAERDSDERVRAFSTRVLGKLRMPVTAELLRKLLGDASPYVRQNAAWGLGQLGDRNAGPLLQRSAQSDADPAVRESARDALRNIDRASAR